MAKVTLDIEEIKKGLKTRALQAASELTELAKRAKTDLSQENVLKKVDEVVAIVKSQDFMKNPKVAELANKIVALSEQIEKHVKENVAPFVDEVRARVTKATAKATSKATSAATDDSAFGDLADESETKEPKAAKKKKTAKKS